MMPTIAVSQRLKLRSTFLVYLFIFKYICYYIGKFFRWWEFTRSEHRRDYIPHLWGAVCWGAAPGGPEALGFPTCSS